MEDNLWWKTYFDAVKSPELIEMFWLSPRSIQACWLLPRCRMKQIHSKNCVLTKLMIRGRNWRSKLMSTALTSYKKVECQQCTQQDGPGIMTGDQNHSSATPKKHLEKSKQMIVRIFSCDEQLKKWRCHSVRVFVCSCFRLFVPFVLLVSSDFHIVLKSFNGVSRKF